MSEEGVRVGTGYIEVVPSAKGFMGSLQTQVAPSFARVGDDGGKQVGKGLLGGVGAAAGKLFAPIATAMAGVEVAKFFGDSVAEAREAEKVGKTTAAIIKTTGGVAKITAEEVGDLTSALSAKAGMDDEAIQTGANFLLTFKNVRNEVGAGNDMFNRATAAAVDLSAAGFGSVEGASKMLGKALNDPIKGVGALGRAGVTFSEDQKKTIKQMVLTGDVLGAQKMIMKEVESQVGGVAEANATASEKMSVAWGNFQEFIGTKITPVLDTVQMFMVDTLLPAATEVVDAMGALGDLIFKGDYNGALRDLFGWEEDHPLVGFVLDLRRGILDLFDPTTRMQGPMKKFADGGAEIMNSLKRMWQAIEPIFLAVWRVVQEKWVELAPTVAEIFEDIRMSINDAMTVAKKIIETVTGVITVIWDRWGDNITRQIGIFMDVVVGVFRGAFQIISGVWQTLAGALTGDTQKARDGVEKIFGGMKGVLGSVFGGIVSTIGNAWDGIKKAFSGPVNWVLSNVINPLISAVNGVAKTFGLALGLKPLSLMSSGASSSASGSSSGAQRAMAGGGILDGFTPFSRGDDQLVAMRSGEGVYVSEAMLDPYERWRLNEVNRRALSGQSFQDLQPGHDLAGLAGGGIVPNASQGFRGYNPGFLSAIKAWAAATGRMWSMTGNGGARSFADQLRAWTLFQSGRGPLAANPWRGGPHMIPGNAMDLSPRPGDIPSAHKLLAAFGLGTPVPGERWHVGWAGGGSRGGGGGGGGGLFDISSFIKSAVGGLLSKDYAGGGAIGQIMNSIPDWILKGATTKIKSLFGFDEGGWMQPDMMGANFLKKPEPVFSPSQWDILKGNLTDGRAGASYHVDNLNVTIPVDDVLQIRSLVDLFNGLELNTLMAEEVH